jgi:serine/threonine protein kinase
MVVRKDTGERFAAKIIKLKHDTNQNQLEREVEILRKVKHPNIVSIVDVFRISNKMFLILDLATGMNYSHSLHFSLYFTYTPSRRRVI